MHYQLEEEYYTELIKTLKLDKTTLSAFQLKRKSASDIRRSSFYLGCVSIVFLAGCGLFIVILDLAQAFGNTKKEKGQV